MDIPHYQMLSGTTTQPLKMEGQRAPWFSKLLATSSSWSLLVGYLVLTLALEKDSDLSVPKFGLIAFSSVIVSVAYTVSVVLCLYGGQSFLLDYVYLPFMGSSLMGLANAVFTVLCRGFLPLSQLGVVVVTLSAISTSIYGVAASIMFMKEHARLEQRRRQGRHLSPEDGAPLISDDDMQRQQFSKLLQKKADTAPSPRALQETYRIDLPGNMSPRVERGRSIFPPGNSRGQQTSYSSSPYGERLAWEMRSTQLPRSAEPSCKRGRSDEAES